MDTKTTLTPQDWTQIRAMAKDGRLSVGVELIDKAKAGKRRITEDVACEIHALTEGAIPCWALRPDRWAPGQLPPSIHGSSLPAAS